MRKTAKVVFLGPISRSNGDKKGFTFSTLQADGGLIQLEYPSRTAAVMARRTLAHADFAVVIPSTKIFETIAMAIDEAKALVTGEPKIVDGVRVE